MQLVNMAGHIFTPPRNPIFQREGQTKYGNVSRPRRRCCQAPSPAGGAAADVFPVDPQPINWKNIDVDAAVSAILNILVTTPSAQPYTRKVRVEGPV